MFVKCGSFSMFPPEGSNLLLFAPTCLVWNPLASREGCKEQGAEFHDQLRRGTQCSLASFILHCRLLKCQSPLCLPSLTLIKEYVRFFSEPVPKRKSQVVHSVKLRKDQLYLKFLVCLFSPETFHKHLL